MVEYKRIEDLAKVNEQLEAAKKILREEKKAATEKKRLAQEKRERDAALKRRAVREGKRNGKAANCNVSDVATADKRKGVCVCVMLFLSGEKCTLKFGPKDKAASLATVAAKVRAAPSPLPALPEEPPVPAAPPQQQQQEEEEEEEEEEGERRE